MSPAFNLFSPNSSLHITPSVASPARKHILRERERYVERDMLRERETLTNEDEEA